jgi:hypothetical protein
MLAEKTGWSEHFILWELPLHRFNQYIHAAMRASDVWTVLPMEAPEKMAEAAILAASSADNDDDYED